MGTVGVHHRARGGQRVAWGWFLGVGAAIAVGYYVLPLLSMPRVAQSLLYIVISMTAAVTVLVGVAVHRPPGRLPWLILAGAQGMYTIGDATFFVLHTVMDRTEYPDLSDVFYLAQYPLICFGLLVFIRRRTPGRDAVTLIDAAVLAVVGGLLSWVYVLSPLASGESSALAATVNIAYPVMDLLVLAVALRLMLGVGSRPGAYRLLIASLTLQLVADVAYALARDTYQDGSTIDALWIGAYFLLGAAALHPSMRTLDRRSARVAVKPTRGRLAVLAGASLLPFTVLVSQQLRHADIHLVPVVIAGAGTVLLVLARMAEQVSTQRMLAIHDGLTGAYTFDLASESLRLECDRARYTRGDVGVLLVDMDNFGLINEMHGEAGGDAVLLEAARRLNTACRPGDLVSRTGDDKFLVLLPGAHAQQVNQMAERVRAAVSANHVPIDDNVRVRVTASVGAACMPVDGVTPQDLLNAVAQAIHAAKRSGRNRAYTCHGPIGERVPFSYDEPGTWSRTP